EGNQLAVTDARGNTVLTTDYDQLGHALHTSSVDAGDHWTLADVTGQPLRGWDSRDFLVRTSYDVLRRPLGVYVSQAGGTERLAEYTIYGDAPGVPSAASHNLRGRVYQHFDAAGLATMDPY